MAEVCCEVAAGTDGTTAKSIAQPKSRTARRRRVEIRQLKSDSSNPPEGLNMKRPRLDSSSLENDESGSSNQSPTHGVSSVCGRRREMEDAVSVRPSFVEIGDAYHFYGVFDGHGCCHVADSCKDRMHEIVSEEMKNRIGPEEAKGEEWWKGTMERSFLKMDSEVSKGKLVSPDCPCVLRTQKSDHVGSTAVVSIVGPKHIVVANCGDSRAVLCREGTAIALSSDHKPDREDELKRIEDAGGRVIYWDGARVLGMLAMSRAIGDNYLKPYVIPDPEVTVTERSNSDEFLILASDGLWDVLSKEKACQIVRTCLRTRNNGKVRKGDETEESQDTKPKLEPGLSQACVDAALLLTKVAISRQSSDNISVVVVDLRARKL